MDSLNHDNQSDVIEADNPYFEGMVNQISLNLQL